MGTPEEAEGGPPERSQDSSQDSTPDRLADRPLDRPHPSRLAPGPPRWTEIIDAHRSAIFRGESGYLDPETGLFVLTAAHLADRGQCCGSGCRHCPYLA
jgi:hypothetical protein